jgi:hypothetical protein
MHHCQKQSLSQDHGTPSSCDPDTAVGSRWSGYDGGDSRSKDKKKDPTVMYLTWMYDCLVTDQAVGETLPDGVGDLCPVVLHDDV